LTLTYQH